MSKQKGIIKLVGNIGGMSFYTSNGEYLARTAGGPTKERIATGANFVRTRENNAEFGGSAKVGKALRTALSSVIQTMGGSTLTASLTRLFKSINVKASGARGQRPIALSANKAQAKGLELNNKISFTSVFNAPYAVTTDADRVEVVFTIPNFIPINFINAPSGATGFRIAGAVGWLSDYSFDDGTASYEPDNPDQNSLSMTQYSTIQPITNVGTNITLTATAPGGLVPEAGVSVIACLGIEFYQKVDNVDYLLAQGNAMRIIEVF
ncbi:hypothetical protein FIA58_020120 [Flavobacterium jejuense]|uniref:Uncharacterized protein n=1 Tax=Flavobacterium jejuense TaxID=1544455 RepID=A0ABX0IW01_9FLAO|nr:hypothetical protein [Flavobacterium jejuense]NHN27992.1 hypothetical protein [Flavobacterium jejuense]